MKRYGFVEVYGGSIYDRPKFEETKNGEYCRVSDVQIENEKLKADKVELEIKLSILMGDSVENIEANAIDKMRESFITDDNTQVISMNDISNYANKLRDKS